MYTLRPHICIKFGFRIKHQSSHWVIQEMMKIIKHHVIHGHETHEPCGFQHGGTDHINKAIINYWTSKQNGRRSLKQCDHITPTTSELEPK